MAQLVERLHGMEEVAGSSPAGSTRSEEFGPDEVGVEREALAFGWVHQKFFLIPGPVVKW